MQTLEFPNYTQIKPRIPQWFWHVLRVLTLSLTVFVIYLLLYQPVLGLVVFWNLLIPLLPISFAVIPGLWRNICPMAFLNQIPQMAGIGSQRTLSGFARRLALLFSLLVFIIFVASRAPLLNYNSTALGIILISALILAFVGGLVYKGRSGWCGTFCPLAPLQKIYGHAPLVIVRNGYCKTCVGCQRNCYDFNPRAAIFSDLDRSDAWWSDKRKYLAAALPGLIVGFYTASSPDQVGLLSYFNSIFTPLLVSIGVFYTLQNALSLSDFRAVTLSGITALGIFYWYGIPVLATGIEQVFQYRISGNLIIFLQFIAFTICVAVIIRGRSSERTSQLAEQTASMASVGSGIHVLKAAVKENENNVLVKEQSSGKMLDVRPGQNLLEVIESAELPIMSGCRMGMCGSDPVVITEGSENLPPPDENELTTLRRLGLEGKARLACCCKPEKNISIDLSASPDDIEVESSEIEVPNITQDVNRLKIIVIGNGIAGISTIEHIRESDTDCQITLISQEPHHFYNRMGLEQVVHGHTAMQGLYLMQEEWYQRNNIDVWLNTRVASIDSKFNHIVLGSGETLPYDKLVLATGGKAFVPPIVGSDMPGCFTLRDADDAVSIRAWVQTHECKQAVVLGGGVLGIEAADTLRQLGLKVTIVHTSYQLMNRQLDLHAGVILKRFLKNSGIDVRTDTGIHRIDGEERLRSVVLSDGSVLSSDLLLFCIGIRANIRLAESIGLKVNNGVVVNANMKTSNPDVYCVGDAAEYPGAISGLWSVGSEQGKVAAASILGNGNDTEYEDKLMHPVQLKVNNIDLKCFGDLNESDNIKSYMGGNVEQHKWQHVLVKEGEITGGVFVNASVTANTIITGIKKNDKKLSSDEIRRLLSLDDT